MPFSRQRTLADVTRAGQRGMSLVEVMVVIVIILTLMSAVAFGVYNTYEGSKVDTTTLQIGRIGQQVDIYILRKKKAPSSLEEVFGDEQLPVDGWGNPFVLVTPGPGRMKYDVISLGADGAEGGTGNDADIKYSEAR